MPKVVKENSEAGKVTLIVEVSEHDSKPYLERAAQKLSEEKPLKGFRPGKVDLETAMKSYGDMEVYEAALDSIVRGTLPEAVTEHDIQFVGSPDVSVIKCAPGNPISYKAIFLLAPSVTLADISKIKLERKKTIIDDARVDSVLSELQESRASEVKTERAVQEGDHIVADVQLYLDKVPLDANTMKAQHFIVGKQELWPGFGKALIGAKHNEKKEFTLEIPADHMQKNIAGKKIEFAVTVHEVFERTLPTIDDAFAKGLGAFKDLADLRQQLKKNLETESAHKEQERIENELLAKLVEASTFTEIPKELIEYEKDRVIAETKQMITNRGMEWEKYLEHLKKTEAEVREGYSEAAEKRIKNNLVMVALAKVRGTEATEEEINREFQAYVQYNPDVTKEPDGVARIKEHIKIMIAHRKALAEVVNEVAKEV